MNLLYKLIIFERRFQASFRYLIDAIIHRYPSKNLRIRRWPPKNFYIYTQGPTGDIALLSSLTQYIKQKYKNTRIYFVTDPKYIKLAKSNPDIYKVVPLKLSTIANYGTIEKATKKMRFDAFLIASPHPNLRYLIPQLHISKMSFFLMGDLPNFIPTPRLTPPLSNPSKRPYFVINFIAPTFGSHKNIPTPEQFIELTNKIITSNPDVLFYIKQDPMIMEEYNYENAKTFAHDFDTILNLSINSNGLINVRSGLNDVLAAMSPVPQLIIYPDGKFPDDNGVDCVTWSSLQNMGFVAKIAETRINKFKNPSLTRCLKKINKFIEANNK